MASSILKKFGKKVRTLRNERGVSQEELGRIAKLHRTYIGMIERGEKNITLENVEKISDALGVSVHKMFADL